MQEPQALKLLTDVLLSNDSTWLERREALQQMHHLFFSFNQFDAYQPSLHTEGEWLPNGCAISPRGAAMCLFEIKRTRVFVQGIIIAIKQLLFEQKKKPIHILDAGCGPYALLSLLAAQYFTADEVQFHLLDIHETNIMASKKLIDALKFTDWFSSFTIADACTYQWQQKEQLHLVITETMLNALRKEPQVSITLNLSKQLANGGLLIPQKIEVDLIQVNNPLKNKISQNAIGTADYSDPDYAQYEKKAGNIITLTKETTATEIAANPIAVIHIPTEHEPDNHSLEFYTTITVFDDLILHHNDSSLTMPLKFSRPNKNPISAGTAVAFSYNTSTNPGIEFVIGG